MSNVTQRDVDGLNGTVFLVVAVVGGQVLLGVRAGPVVVVLLQNAEEGCIRRGMPAAVEQKNIDRARGHERPQVAVRGEAARQQVHEGRRLHASIGTDDGDFRSVDDPLHERRLKVLRALGQFVQAAQLEARDVGMLVLGGGHGNGFLECVWMLIRRWRSACVGIGGAGRAAAGHEPVAPGQNLCLNPANGRAAGGAQAHGFGKVRLRVDEGFLEAHDGHDPLDADEPDGGRILRFAFNGNAHGEQRRVAVSVFFCQIGERICTMWSASISPMARWPITG